MPAIVRLLLTPVIVLAVLLAGLTFAFSWFDNAPFATLVAKRLLSAAVFVFGQFLLHWLWATGPLHAWQKWCVFAGGLALVALGAAGAVWTAHLGLVTGDWEYYGFVGNGLLVVEGILAVSWVALLQTDDDRPQALSC